MLGSLIPYLKTMRTIMSQLYGFYHKPESLSCGEPRTSKDFQDQVAILPWDFNRALKIKKIGSSSVALKDSVRVSGYYRGLNKWY